ncbi:ethanolamine utilization protein EutN/carboxysome structural protein Ccml [Salmonella enterica subsp. enterica]|nr:ethanolamine utilization protein EutN/carboxysome structural protein Ccml [Salmonella enterica subsp. enterica]
MHLARVTGAVVSTQKSPSLIGKKLLLVRRVSADGELPPRPHLAMKWPWTPSARASANWFCSAAAPAPGTFFPGQMRPSTSPLLAL